MFPSLEGLGSLWGSLDSVAVLWGSGWPGSGGGFIHGATTMTSDFSSLTYWPKVAQMRLSIVTIAWSAISEVANKRVSSAYRISYKVEDFGGVVLVST